MIIPLATIHIALGSNLGDRHLHLYSALGLLDEHADITIAAVSEFFEYPALTKNPAEAQPDYLNGVLAATTTLSPASVLVALEQIEYLLGRTGKSDWAPRTIDLDLLLYDKLTLQTPALTLPHPHLHTRRFVLEPLASLAPGLVHPVLNKTVQQLLGDLKESV